MTFYLGLTLIIPFSVAFQNPEIFAEIVGLSANLINRINIMRICLASTLKKDEVEFPMFCLETKMLYIDECGFYPLNPTFHKVFEHSPEILRLLPATLSSGMTTEEPGECANKDLKSFQIDHAFQGDPQRRNLDTFHRLMDRSCPAVLEFLVDAKLEKRAKEPLPAEVIALLKNPEVQPK